MVDSARKGRNCNQKKTACVNGHAFTPENTYVDPHGHRGCKSCMWASHLRRQAKLKQMAAAAAPK